MILNVIHAYYKKKNFINFLMYAYYFSIHDNCFAILNVAVIFKSCAIYFYLHFLILFSRLLSFDT